MKSINELIAESGFSYEAQLNAIREDIHRKLLSQLAEAGLAEENATIRTETVSVRHLFPPQTTSRTMLLVTHDYLISQGYILEITAEYDSSEEQV